MLKEREGVSAAEEGKTSAQERARETLAEKRARALVKLTGEVQVTGSHVYYQAGNSVRSIERDLSVARPEPTGQETLDKRREKASQSEISAKQRDVVKLQELGQLSAVEAETLLNQLESMRGTGTQGRGGASSRRQNQVLARLFRDLRGVSGAPSSSRKSPRLPRVRSRSLSSGSQVRTLGSRTARSSQSPRLPSRGEIDELVRKFAGRAA